MPTATFWERAKTGSKNGFDKVYTLVDKLGPPVNKLTNKLGSEAFWPTTLDKESEKAARILRSFCKDGFYQEETVQTQDGPTAKQRVLKSIPTEVIRRAKGLAIFTTMRSGLWFSGAGGSGILIGRKEDGTWSPPSGILLHTAAIGFLVGVDIYDCVLVINTQKALDAFSSMRCTVGGEISAVVGPVGVGGILDTELHKRQAPIFTYLKSRGFYAGVQIDGTVLIERGDENEKFYGQRLSVKEIMAGKVRHPPYELRGLFETLKAAQGDNDVNESLLPVEPAPADFEIEESGHIFGVPDPEDPDPYGVLALQSEGMQIKEAGTGTRVTSEAFEFKPSASSPIYKAYTESPRRRSLDSGLSKRSSWRSSNISTITVDMATQTDFGDENKLGSSRHGKRGSQESFGSSGSGSLDGIPEGDGNAHDESRVKRGEIHLQDHEADILRPSMDSIQDSDDEPVVHEVQQAAAPQVISRARLVSVRRRSPPKLPPRNPGRMRNGGPVVFHASPILSSEDKSMAVSAAPTISANIHELRRRSSDDLSDGSKTHVGSEHSMSEAFEKIDLTAEKGEVPQPVKIESDEFHSLPVTPKDEVPNPWGGR